MNYLQDLAGGLRAASGILNPRIQQSLMDQEKEDRSRQDQQSQLLFAQLAKQVENGSITPDQASQAARARGINVDTTLFGGPSLEAQAKGVTLAKEQRKQAILAHPAIQQMLANGEYGKVEDVLLSAGVIDPMELAKQRAAERKPVAVAQGGRLVNPQTGETVAEGAPKPQTPLKIDRFPIGNGNVQPHISLDGGNTWKPVPGSQPIAAKEVSGSTTVNVQNGPMGLGKPAQGKVDEGLLETTQGLMRLDQIQSQFKPEYQTFLGKGNAWWSGIKASAGVNLGDTERKQLEEFSTYRRNAINSLNEYIKSVTGAAMSEAEAQRILKGMPNPGQGIFDGDDPVSFKAKLDDAIRLAKLSAARLTYIKRNGLSLTDASGNPVIQLDRMPALMNERGQQIENQLRERDSKLTREQIQKLTRRQLAQEFGLVE